MEKTRRPRLPMLQKRKEMLDVHQKQDLKHMKKKDGNETESGEENETVHEKNSCHLLQNISLMDRDLVLVCAENLSANLILLDKENMDTSIKN